jgi:hypothetical protein
MFNDELSNTNLPLVVAVKSDPGAGNGKSDSTGLETVVELYT